VHKEGLAVRYFPKTHNGNLRKNVDPCQNLVGFSLLLVSDDL
jgi:hypothetical protein